MGLTLALEFVFPDLGRGVPMLVFGRLRQAHVNTVLFAWLSAGMMSAWLYIVPQLTGRKLPADAVVIEGEATVDESLLTGESAPVNKRAGDELFAGTVVTDEALVANVTRPADEGRLAEITRLVEQTLNTKPRIQRLADKASAVLALGIIGAALLTFSGWWLLGNKPPDEALLRISRWAASRFSNCIEYRFELVAAEVSGDMAYTVGYERSKRSVDGGPIEPSTLRVTHVYRRENGEWKVVHRHADFMPADESPHPEASTK
jgi:hypothetical protein